MRCDIIHKELSAYQHLENFNWCWCGTNFYAPPWAISGRFRPECVIRRILLHSCNTGSAGKPVAPKGATELFEIARMSFKLPSSRIEEAAKKNRRREAR